MMPYSSLNHKAHSFWTNFCFNIIVCVTRRHKTYLLLIQASSREKGQFKKFYRETYRNLRQVEYFRNLYGS